MSKQQPPTRTATAKPSKAVDNSTTTSKRLRRDVENLCSEPPTGVFAVPEEDDIRRIHTIIIGPEGTPYQGGYFYFFVTCPSDYPFKPPVVKLMTTDAGRVRFNPNLYHDGKVCLSILGTWEGPKWSPAQTLASCLISIQSIMNERPYFNEPGFNKELKAGDSNRYNEVIRHETLRVAVCGMMEGETKLNVPIELRDKMMVHFLSNYDYFFGAATKGLAIDGQSMQDPFNPRFQPGKFQYQKIIERLQALETGK